MKETFNDIKYEDELIVRNKSRRNCDTKIRELLLFIMKLKI